MNGIKEQELEAIIDSIQEAVVLLNLDGKIVYVNSAYARIFGREPEEVLGKNITIFRESMKPEELERAIKALKEVLNVGKSVRFETTVITTDRRELQLSITYSIIKDLKNEPKNVIAIIRDVTEQKRVEEKQAREEILVETVKAMTDAVLVFDIEGTCIFANPQYAQMFGLKQSDFLGKQIMEIPGIEKQRPEEIEKFMFQFGEAIEKGRAGPIDLDLVAMDGREVPINVAGGTIKDSWGNSTHIIAVARNISQRKKMEEELREHRDHLETLINERTLELTNKAEQLQKEISERKLAEEALRESEECYRQIFEKSPIGIGLSSLDGRIISANKVMESITGYSREELEEINLADIYENPREREILLKKLRRYDSVVDYPVRLMRKDGTLHDVLLTKSMINLDNKDFIHTICQDVTERTQLEEQREQYIHDLKYLSKTAMDFIKLPPEEDIYQHIAEHLKKLVGDSIVIVNSFDPETDLTCVRAISGMGKLSKSVIKILGRDPVGTTYKINEIARNQLLTGKYHKVPGKMHTLSFGQMPKPICYILEKLFRIREIHSMGFTYKGNLLGNVVIILRDDTYLRNKSTIETFINQSAVSLQRRHAEEVLLESEERYRELAESINDVFFAMDRDLRYTYWNKASGKLTGTSVGEALGKSIFDIFPDNEQTRQAVEVYKEVIRTKTSQSFIHEYHLYDKDYYFEISAYPTKDGISVFVKDITERIKTEEALHKERDRAQTYLDLAGVMFVAIDTNGEVTLINKKGCDILGYSEEEVVGKNWFDNFVPKRIKDVISPVSEQLLAGEVEPAEYFENLILTKNGEERLIAWHNTIIKDKKGNIIGYLSSGEDITERKKAEEALIESERRLKEAQRIGGVGDWEFDVQTQDITWSEQVFRLFERNLAQGPPTFEENMAYYYLEDSKKLQDQMRRAIEYGEKFDSEYHLKLPSGRSVYHQGTIRNIKNEEGEVVKLYGTIQDITEHKKTELEIRRRLMKFDLEEGSLYLVKEPSSGISIEAFNDLIKAGFTGIVISRTPKKKYKGHINGHSDFYWLSEKGGDNSLSPKVKDLELWIIRQPRGKVILIDRLDYLISINGFQKVLFFVQSIRELTYLRDQIVILSIDPQTLSAKELRQLELESKEIGTKLGIKIPEDLLDILKFVRNESLIGVRPTYTKIGDEFRLSQPTVRKRIRQLTNGGYLRQDTKGRTKVLELTEKGRSLFYR